jgi:hypothetical protein
MFDFFCKIEYSYILLDICIKMFVIDLVLYKPKTAFKNLSGSVDIWIKINKNDTKDRIVSRLRRKLNDQNI